MATVIKLEETDLDLAGVYDRATNGEEIVIARGEGPKFKLVVDPAPPVRTGERVPGRFAGQIKEAPGVWEPMALEERHPVRRFGSMRGQFKLADSFFDPLPEEELRAWEGE